jgi:hypothetical protein
MRYIDKIKEDVKFIEDINNYILEWNKASSTLRLHEYLGLAEDEYKLWVEQPDYFYRYILEKLKISKDINNNKFTRFEFISKENGRELVKYGLFKVLYQDNNKTIKIFQI